MRAAASGLALAATVLVCATPVPAQRGPIGPCSPYAAADGDIPSELPGCARRRSPDAGSLADELEFRRRPLLRRGWQADDDLAAPDEPSPQRRR